MDTLWSLISKFVKKLTVVNTQRTVRYVFPSMLLSVALLMGASVIKTESESYVRLVPLETMVKSGDRFTIKIYAYAHVPVNAIDLSIKYSPDLVEIITVDKAQSVLTIWTKEPTISTGLISLAGGTFRRGFVGEHIVATIKGTAKFTGSTELAVSAVEMLAGDGLGTPVKTSITSKEGRAGMIIYDQNTDPLELASQLSGTMMVDINGDGVVNLRDISVFMAAWNHKTTQYDFNNDGNMNFIDFSIILARSFFRR